jgi:dienelactone hydrolase
MGVAKFTKHQTIEIAKLGYVAFAPDIYGKTAQPQNTQQAGQAASIYKNSRGLMRKRAQAGLQALLDQNLANPKKIVATGYCFGGTCALELARTGARLAGVVSFHGNLDTPNPADARLIKGPVLILHGADDPYAPKKEVEAFEKEMKAASVNYQVILYPGAVHAFTNPDAGNDPKAGVAYNPSATRKSWGEFKNFLKKVFK